MSLLHEAPLTLVQTAIFWCWRNQFLRGEAELQVRLGCACDDEPSYLLALEEALDMVMLGYCSLVADASREDGGYFLQPTAAARALLAQPQQLVLL